MNVDFWRYRREDHSSNILYRVIIYSTSILLLLLSSIYFLKLRIYRSVRSSATLSRSKTLNSFRVRNPLLSLSYTANIFVQNYSISPTDPGFFLGTILRVSVEDARTLDWFTALSPSPFDILLSSPRPGEFIWLPGLPWGWTCYPLLAQPIRLSYKYMNVLNITIPCLK